LAIKIDTPLSDRVVSSLKAGDEVSISGVIYIARDAAHKRLVSLIESGKDLPFDPRGQIIYYAGPTPPKPGQVIGSVGPTTSGRMDPYTMPLLEQGLRGMIGKGYRSAAVREGLVKHRALYFAAIGGAGVLAGQCMKSAEPIAYAELGPEALWRVEVEDFPAFVVYDIHGGDLYEEGTCKYRATEDLN
jgi:fumarate hydratase subunit beta